MTAAAKRLSRREFTNILENKDILVVYNKLGTLKYLPSAQKAISIVTSSKHEKKAVVRNKLRRRVYTLFHTSPINICGVLYTSKLSFTLSYTEVQSLFYELLKKTQKNPK